ncbi:MAG: SDR family NAD(P)-dependent oxidoreductase [Hyphomicrobiales bacterium]
MTQKTILITGCSTGIGYTCAHGMKARGWKVFATARKDQDIARLQSEGFTTFYLDYCDEASIKACFDSVMAETGDTLDVLFNNGAYGLLGAIEDIKTDDLREQFEANFFGWHSLTKLIIPIMRKQMHGRIVQCSSVLGIVSGKHRSPYAATKHAVEALATSMRMELKAWNIRVSCIRPGPIETEFLATALKVLHEKVDMENTAHKVDYEASLSRMNKGNKSSAFKLGPEAVLAKLIHACEAKSPKPAYSVTKLTYIADIIRRLLPTALAERILAKG